MRLDQYLEVRRCFSAVRKSMPSDLRIIFDEFSILCELHGMRNASASDIAAAQGVSCPTMTHRSNHLCELGLMSRTLDPDDRRKLRCALTRKGTSFVHRTCRSIAQAADPSTELGSLETGDLVKMVAQIGGLPVTADSVVLVTYVAKGTKAMPVMRIVDATGLLQPTVSMAVLRLEEAGYIERQVGEQQGRRPMRRSSGCVLTDGGLARARELVAKIEAL